jgi:hypothetical protein
MANDDHGVRIAILETRMNQYAQDMAELKSDVRSILEKFNQMTGGKKALMALFAVLGFLIGATGSLMSLVFSRH